MADETAEKDGSVAPQEQTTTPGSETAPAPREGDGQSAPAVPAAAGADDKPAAPAPAAAKPQAEDWRNKRIAELTAKLSEERARNKIAAIPTAADPAPAGEARMDEAEVDRRATEKARQMAAGEAFTKACTDVVNSGRKDFADFDSRVNEIRRLADPSDQTSVVQYNTFLQAAIETGEAPKLLHALGGDLNEAHRIMSLPPAKMGVELARMAMREPTSVSNLAKPITPVGNKGRSHDAISPDDKDRSDQLADAEWFRRRNEQVAKQHATR